MVPPHYDLLLSSDAVPLRCFSRCQKVDDIASEFRQFNQWIILFCQEQRVSRWERFRIVSIPSRLRR